METKEQEAKAELKYFFKVTFHYDKNQQGRRVWTELIKVFDVTDSNELQTKIDEYIKECCNSLSERKYDMKMVDVIRI